MSSRIYRTTLPAAEAARLDAVAAAGPVRADDAAVARAAILAGLPVLENAARARLTTPSTSTTDGGEQPATA